MHSVLYWFIELWPELSCWAWSSSGSNSTPNHSTQTIKCTHFTWISLHTVLLWCSHTPVLTLSSSRRSCALGTDLKRRKQKGRKRETGSDRIGSFMSTHRWERQKDMEVKIKQVCVCAYLQARHCSCSERSLSCWRHCWYSEPRRDTGDAQTQTRRWRRKKRVTLMCYRPNTTSDLIVSSVSFIISL